MKKVAIISELSGGGVEQVNRLLASNLDGDIFDVEVISLVTLQEKWKDKNLGFECVFLEAKSKKYAWVQLVRELKRYMPDIICTSCLVETYFCIYYKYFVNHEVKIVYTEHGVFSKTTSGSIKKIVLNNWLPHLLHPFDLIDEVICVSDGVKKDFMNCFPKLKTPCIRIYNPAVQSQKVDELYKPIHKENIKLVTVGRLEAVKCQCDIISAVKELRGRGLNVTLSLYGEGNEKKYLMDYAREIGIEQSIEFKGFSDKIQNEINKYDILVLASSWEAFGMVLVEAMNVGVPVISTNCPVGPSEILKNGQYGNLVHIHKPNEIADAVLKTIQCHSKKKVLDAYRRSEDFTIEKAVKCYEEVYVEVVERKNK